MNEKMNTTEVAQQIRHLTDSNDAGYHQERWNLPEMLKLLTCGDETGRAWVLQTLLSQRNPQAAAVLDLVTEFSDHDLGDAFPAALLEASNSDADEGRSSVRLSAFDKACIEGIGAYLKASGFKGGFVEAVRYSVLFTFAHLNMKDEGDDDHL